MARLTRPARYLIAAMVAAVALTLPRVAFAQLRMSFGAGAGIAGTTDASLSEGRTAPIVMAGPRRRRITVTKTKTLNIGTIDHVLTCPGDTSRHHQRFCHMKSPLRFRYVLFALRRLTGASRVTPISGRRALAIADMEYKEVNLLEALAQVSDPTHDQV